MGSIIRDCMVVNTTILNGAALSAAIFIKDYAGMMVRVPAAWTAADIGVKVSDDGITYAPLRDIAGTLVKVTGVQTAEMDWYAFPDEIFAACFCKLWSINTATGADLNQGADRVMVVLLKG